MTEEQLIERANIFLSLLDHPGWKILESDMAEKIEDVTLQVMQDDANVMFIEKGIVRGIKSVLYYPGEIIEQAQNMKDS